MRTCSTRKTPLYKTLVMKPSTRESFGSYKHRIQYNKESDVKERVNLTFRGPCIVVYSYNKPTRCKNLSNLFCNRTLHISDSFCVHHQEYTQQYIQVMLTACQQAVSITQQQIYIIQVMLTACYQAVSITCMYCCVYSAKTPDDGQSNCPKYVELYSKINLRNQCTSLVLLQE